MHHTQHTTSKYTSSLKQRAFSVVARHAFCGWFCGGGWQSSPRLKTAIRAYALSCLVCIVCICTYVQEVGGYGQACTTCSRSGIFHSVKCIRIRTHSRVSYARNCTQERGLEQCDQFVFSKYEFGIFPEREQSTFEMHRRCTCLLSKY